MCIDWLRKLIVLMNCSKSGLWVFMEEGDSEVKYAVWWGGRAKGLGSQLVGAA